MKIFARAYMCGRDRDPEELKRELAAKNPGCLVQTAREGAARNELLVEMLVAQTFSAEASGSLLAKKPEMDLLLRLGGTTQITRAIRLQGARRGEPYLFVAASRSALVEPPELRKVALPRKKLAGSELARVERAALLSAERA